MKIVDYIYIIESINDIYMKDGWQFEMYETNSKHKTNNFEKICIQIEKVKLLNDVVSANFEYRKKFLKNVSVIREQLPKNLKNKRKFNSKYNYGYRIYFLDDGEIRYNEILRQTVEIEYDTGYTIDIGSRIAEFINIEEFIYRIKSYEKYYFEEKKEIDNGEYTIVVDPELAGLLIHELVGHSFEYDVWLGSEYLQKVLIPGKKTTSKQINIMDNPQYYNGYGSYQYDDEGNKAFTTHLIKDGVVAEFLRSMEYANDVYKSCNARRLTVSEEPLVRMSNTYMRPGNDSIDSIFRNCRKIKCTI